MNRLPMSKAAAGLLRALLARAGEDSHRILLTEVQSSDWQSLTFVGERHQFRFAVRGAGAGNLMDRLTDGLGDAEFEIAGQIVADVAVEEVPVRYSGDCITFGIEALTIAA